MKYSGYRNTDASILVYKFRPKRTGFNMYAEYTRTQLTFLALHPCDLHFINSLFTEILDFSIFSLINVASIKASTFLMK